MAKNEDYKKIRNGKIKDMATEFVKLLENHDEVINLMQDEKKNKGMIILEHKTELCRQSEYNGKAKYLIEKVVPTFDEPCYAKFKTILKETGNAKLSDNLPGEKCMMDNGDRDFYANKVDCVMNEKDKELSKYICYIYSEKENTTLSSAFIIGHKILDSKTEKYYRYILTSYEPVMNCMGGDNHARFGKLESSDTFKFEVKIQPTGYVCDTEPKNYILLALEPSDELDQYLGENVEPATNKTKERPRCDSLMVFGYPKGNSLKLFDVKVADEWKYLYCDESTKYSTYDVAGGMCFTIDDHYPYAMTTKIDKQDNDQEENRVKHKVTYICDIISHIKSQIDHHIESPINDRVFKQLFPKYNE